MLTGIHFLLTYTCNLECDHCFCYSSPKARGTFTLRQLREALGEAKKIGTVEWIYFEGGEPWLFYPLMLEGIKLSRELEFKVGIVTNAYGAICEEDAELWLRPLAELGVSYLSVSDDSFHYGDEQDSPPKLVLAAAHRLGIPCAPICIEEPEVQTEPPEDDHKGQPVVGGGVMFRGRAVEKLTAGLPTRYWEELVECPHEDLATPARVHIDSYGNVHLCQGLSMGNMWETSLSTLLETYSADSHPICRPLIRGGPAMLAKEYDVGHMSKYVDECHFCYLIRRALIDKFPQFLGPRQVYGLEQM